MTRALEIVVVVLALAAPAAGQTRPGPAPPLPAISFRAFALLTGESFAASKTFQVGFGSSFQTFWGAGVEVTFHDGPFVDVAVARFRKTGQRAFLFNGQTFRLGIPMTATITPVEVSGGYRFHLRRLRWMIPYAAAGVGTYAYTEVSGFAEGGENVSVRHAGFLATGGAEFRLSRWVGVSGDAQYTHVPGILGSGGISQQAGESDLGGVAVRVRVIIGR
jgi:hypothetical protein